MKFFEAVANAFRIPDLRNRILFTLGLLAIYRLGGHIPTPGIDAERLEEFFKQNQGTLLGFFDLFSGGMFRRLTIFALGIMPYITSSIILQLMTIMVPTLEKLQKEGEIGRRKITQYTRYLTVVLCLLQGIGISYWLQRQPGLIPGRGLGFFFIATVTMMTGTMFIMWIGEQITERGAFAFGFAQVFFFFFIVLPCMRGHGAKAPQRPWEGAEGLEWEVPSPAPHHTFENPPKLNAEATKVIG